MRVVIAPDKFKGSLTASQAAQAMARGVRSVLPSAEIEQVPMADGGEGIVEALVAATGGTFHTAEATGPLGKPVQARFGMLGDGRTAVVEMATASGLVLVPADKRDPLSTTTRGTGELLLAAVAAGARRLIVGIGGSASNDGGAGLAQALGFRLLDSDGQEIGPGGGPLGRLARIEPGGRTPGLSGVEIAVACDVTNPLCGPDGASAVYGPQKGATPEMVAELDRNLTRLAQVVERDLGVSIATIPGAGAAGGLGGGLVAFAGGRLERGIDLVIDAVGLKDHLKRADLCLTGEGSLDAQSAFGKTAVGVARLARSFGCPTIALVGSIGDGAEKALDEGIDAYFSICPGPIRLETAVAEASNLLEKAAEQAFRGFLAGSRHRKRGDRRV
ncbi:glycerate kinase [Paludisphaera borealis]|uniref:Glycerate 2-kinase n=1 Tax=Paludisphaera borealis TaxID=1387353 RepID=A0A1U7CWX7_9BACT|nr:glycerate kinase [Paludisphaera borealis]APW63398.1 Glycerate 2-kinase [Paludisphaera borealis]